MTTHDIIVFQFQEIIIIAVVLWPALDIHNNIIHQSLWIIFMYYAIMHHSAHSPFFMKVTIIKKNNDYVIELSWT